MVVFPSTTADRAAGLMLFLWPERSAGYEHILYTEKIL